MEKIPSLFKCGTLASRPESGEAVVVVGGLSLFEGITLPACEMDRARSISSIEARGRFLAARRLVRGVLSAWFTMEGSDVPIQLSEGGKPYVAVKAMPRFSISHSADLVAAVFYESDAGIDLEVERSLDHVALAQRFFRSRKPNSWPHPRILHSFSGCGHAERPRSRPAERAWPSCWNPQELPATTANVFGSIAEGHPGKSSRGK